MNTTESGALNISILDTEQMSLWDEFVFTRQAGTIYHTSAWRSVIESVYGHNPLYFALIDNGRILAGLPVFQIKSLFTGSRLSTVPCAQTCTPLADTGQQYQMLKHGIREYMVGEKIRGWQIKTTDAFLFEDDSHAVRDDGFMTHVLRIDRPVEDIYQGVHKNHIRRSIQKAVKHGIQMKRCESPAGVRLFYTLYMHMRRREGLLPQPLFFFQSLWDRFHPKGMIDILFAEYQGRVISTILLLKYRETVSYEYGATEKGAHAYSPSPFLLWYAIKDAAEQGYSIFDFGRTSEEETGLVRFKDHWGASRQVLRYYEMTNASAIGVMRKSGMTRMLMKYSMKYLPDAVCHMAGRFLYRHLV
jgi:hypothetical protein